MLMIFTAMATTFAPQLTESEPHTTSTPTGSTNTATLSTVEVDSDISHEDNGIVGGISADIGGPFIHSDNLPEIDSPDGLSNSVPEVGIDSKAQDHTGQGMVYSSPTYPETNTGMPPVMHDKKSDNHNSSGTSTNADKSFSTVANTTEISFNNMSADTSTSSHLSSQDNFEQYSNISSKPNSPAVLTANTSPSPIYSSAMNNIITIIFGNVNTSTKTSEIPRGSASSSTVFPAKESDSSSIDLTKVTPSNGPSSESATYSSSSLRMASPESEYLPENCKGDKSVKLQAKSGFITSPGFENNQPYPPNISCNWEIEDQKHEVVNLYKFFYCLLQREN